MSNAEDRRLVTGLLGREPRGAFEVVVRHPDGSPVVIVNAPFLDDGTPMPTRYWLVGEPERTWVGRLESAGGVAEAERAVSAAALATAHRKYAAERDALIAPTRAGARPAGGVGGTRRGVKCLHAHFAWWLAGGDDPVGGWVAAKLAEQGQVASVVGPRDVAVSCGVTPVQAANQGEVVAAIDCGTNSTRLLVARHEPDGGLSTLTRQMRITQLGQGVDATGRLDSEAMGRTLEVLRNYRAEMDACGVGRVRITATSAARDATNRERFFEPVAGIIGTAVELLSGDDEAALSFTGATAELRDRPGSYLVVDIGGGSTEFAAGTVTADAVTIGGAESVDIGCVRLTERFIASDPPRGDELRSARAYCDDVVAPTLDRVSGARDAHTLVGLAGTVSTLASVDLGLGRDERDRVHHHVLDAARVQHLTRRLCAMSAFERRDVPGMEPERAEVIIGGLMVLGSLMAQSGQDELLVSEADILDGLAASIL